MQRLADLSPLELELETLRRENKILREQLTLLKQHIFGRKSERLAPGQLAFVEEGALPQPEPTSEPAQPNAPKKKPSKGHGRAAFPEHLFGHCRVFLELWGHLTDIREGLAAAATSAAAAA